MVCFLFSIQKIKVWFLSSGQNSNHILSYLHYILLSSSLRNSSLQKLGSADNSIYLHIVCEHFSSSFFSLQPYFLHSRISIDGRSLHLECMMRTQNLYYIAGFYKLSIGSISNGHYSSLVFEVFFNENEKNGFGAGCETHQHY